jgi:hypothetical protein
MELLDWGQWGMGERPIKNCYWVVPGQLLAGEYPRDLDDGSSQAKIDALVASGVTVFIDLTHPYDRLEPYRHLLDAHRSNEVKHLQFPIRDVSVPVSKEQTSEILDVIDHHLGRGGIVYVHCWGGVGRTGVIVGCWLARHGHPGGKALLHLRELWKQCPKSASRRSPETEEQERYIVNWVES